MKRITAALIALAVTCVVVSASSAGVRYSAPITLLKHAVNSGTINNATTQDTAYFSHQSARTDTFLFNLPNRGFAPYVLGADSLSLFDIFISPDPSRNTAAGTTAGLDTVYLTLSGTTNGSDWVSAPQVAVLEVGTSNVVFKGWNTTRLGAITAAAATNLQMGPFASYRLEVLSDATGAFKVEMRYWQDNVTNP